MAAVAPAVCIVNIRERLLRRYVRSIDAIAEQVVRRDIEARTKNTARDDSFGNVDDIIGKPAAIGESCRITSEQTQALTVRPGGWGYAGVEAQKIGDWAGRSACRGDRRRIGHKR